MQQAIRFMKQYGNLGDADKNPFFTGKSFSGYTHPLARRASHSAEDHLSQPPMSGEQVYAGDFRQINLQKLTTAEFEALPLSDIPDSEEFALIDIGSHLGMRVTRPFARAKPNVQVMMVDYLSRDQVMDIGNYRVLPPHVVQREPLQGPIPFRDSVEDTVNELMEINNLPNVTYQQKWLTPGKNDLTLPSTIQGKRVVVTGWHNPAGLGTITAQIAADLGAESLYFNNSGLEKINPSSQHAEEFIEYLSTHFSSEEAIKVFDLMHGPQSSRSSAKYDYKKSEEKMFASTLLLFFALYQKEMLADAGYNVSIFANSDAQHYNNPAHHIVGNKK